MGKIHVFYFHEDRCGVFQQSGIFTSIDYGLSSHFIFIYNSQLFCVESCTSQILLSEINDFE